MSLQIVKKGANVLRLKAKRVEKFDKNLRILVKNMRWTMKANGGVGLAAPQVGVPLSIFVFDDRSGNSGVFINPEAMIVEGKPVLGWEGCLSVPNQRFMVPRAEKIVIKGQDIDGSYKELGNFSYLAVIFQHEIDHLVGTLISDYLAESDIHQAIDEARNGKENSES